MAGVKDFFWTMRGNKSGAQHSISPCGSICTLPTNLGARFRFVGYHVTVEGGTLWRIERGECAQQHPSNSTQPGFAPFPVEIPPRWFNFPDTCCRHELRRGDDVTESRVRMKTNGHLKMANAHGTSL
eukprot:1195226-Prorocentrum_minimum.AAC.2